MKIALNEKPVAEITTSKGPHRTRVRAVTVVNACVHLKCFLTRRE